MTPKETAAAVAYCSALWPRQPMDVQRVAPAWHRLLGEHDAGAVRDAIDAHARASQWPPTVADLLAQLEPGDDSGSAFGAVMAAILAPPGDRDRMVGPRAAETIRRLGGWGVVGQWRRDRIGLHMRDFDRVYAGVRPDTSDLRALASAEKGPGALPAGSGPECEKASTVESGASDRVSQDAGLLERMGLGKSQLFRRVSKK